ncbi:hypothetical protein ACFQ51_40380 [Streptomyces kaempferi]
MPLRLAQGGTRPFREECRPLRGSAQQNGPGGNRRGQIAAEDGLEQVDADNIRETGHEELGEFVSCSLQFQAGADACAGLAEQGQPLS